MGLGVVKGFISVCVGKMSKERKKKPNPNRSLSGNKSPNPRTESRSEINLLCKENITNLPYEGENVLYKTLFRSHAALRSSISPEACSSTEIVNNLGETDSFCPKMRS